MDPTLQANLSPQALLTLNVILGIVVFGIAIDLRPRDFRRVFELPRAAAAGLTAQFLLLPAVTFALIQILRPPPEIALGMLLVSACPGGNISNFVTHVARGHSALSVTMTAISTLAAIVMTPLNFSFWGSLDPQLAPLLRTVELSFGDMLQMIVIMLGIPLVIGMWLAVNHPTLAARARLPLRWFSFLAFFAFVAVALSKNFTAFMTGLPLVGAAVVIHNAVAFATGYAMARLMRLPEAETRAVTIEVGIQNSGLGLILIFNFFDGMAGMALIAASWGLWHLISGGALAGFWSRREPSIQALSEPA